MRGSWQVRLLQGRLAEADQRLRDLLRATQRQLEAAAAQVRLGPCEAPACHQVLVGTMFEPVAKASSELKHEQLAFRDTTEAPTLSGHNDTCCRQRSCSHA